MTELRNGNSQPLAFLTHPRQIRASGGGKCMPLNLPPSAAGTSVRVHAARVRHPDGQLIAGPTAESELWNSG